MPKITKDYGELAQTCVKCGSHLHRAAILDRPGIAGEEATIRRYCPTCFAEKNKPAEDGGE